MNELLSLYQKVYGMLEDEESRDIYLNRLNGLISRDYRYIANVVKAYLPGLQVLNGKTIKDFQNLLPKDRKIVLYGAGAVGKELLPYWADDERFIGFCSGTKEKQAHGYLGYPVMPPEELLARRDLSVVISTTRASDEILQILLEGGYPKEQIFEIGGYYRKEDRGQYFNPEFIRYEPEEVLVDAGSFDLSSALELKKYCKHVKKVYAFEPDPDNYRLCVWKKARYDFSEAEIIPYGTWNERKELRFCAVGAGYSNICETGEISIPVMPIDEAIHPGDKVTFIKMDVEGSELESLKGAKNTILRDKPKLAICIYHKPEDMVTIPLYIKELVPEYKLYVRRHSNSWAETVLYAVLPE